MHCTTGLHDVINLTQLVTVCVCKSVCVYQENEMQGASTSSPLGSPRLQPGRDEPSPVFQDRTSPTGNAACMSLAELSLGQPPRPAGCNAWTARYTAIVMDKGMTCAALRQ